MKNTPSIPQTPPIPHPETDAEREAREAFEEEEEDRYVNTIITDLFDEYIGCERESWRKGKDGKDRHDYRDKLLFLYSIPGSSFDWMNKRMNNFNARRREGFLAEAIARRDTMADLAFLIDCSPSQIARSMKEITSETRAYVGVLEEGMFEKLPKTIEHIYTSFPEGRVRREQVEIGGKTVEELRAEMKKAKFQVDDNGMMDTDDFKKSIHEPPQFTKLKSPEKIDCVRLTVASLGFPNGATVQQIFDKALLLGLELCPPEVGPYYRLQYKNQPMYEYIRIGMKPIFGRDRYPHVFNVGRDGGGAWLGRGWAGPSYEWVADDGVMFRYRKSDS